MGKYGFDYSRLEKLEAENRNIIAINGEMKKRIEELTEIINEMKASKKPPVSKRQYRDIFSDEVYESLFGKYPDSNGLMVSCNQERKEKNCTNFTRNIVLCILPKVHLIQDKKPTRTERYTLSGKNLTDMNEKEYQIIRKALEEIAEIMNRAKKSLDLTDEEVIEMFSEHEEEK